jgi:serine/threonine protein kinase
MEPGTLQEFKIAAKKLMCVKGRLHLSLWYGVDCFVLFPRTLPPHPNVVQVYGVSIDGPQPVIVMEYCPGGLPFSCWISSQTFWTR